MVSGKTIAASSDTYLQHLKSLQSGDTLLLQSGVYENGLPINKLVGTARSPIGILPDDKERPLLIIATRGYNTISIGDLAYVMISGLVLDGRGNVIDGAGTGMYVGNSKGTGAFVGGLIEYSLTTVSKPVDVYSDMIETHRALAKRLF